MGLFKKLFGFRWSLYIVRDDNKITYAMHENSVIRILGYVMDYFSNGKTPVHPWSLHLNFNQKHQSFELRPEHFTPDGENVTNLLIQKIESIDPGWKVKGGEPVFEEAATKKKLKISNTTVDNIDLRAMMENLDKPKEVTFFGVMNEVFGGQR